MDGWVRVLRPFNSISVISRRWKGEHERLCAMKRRLGREESPLQRDSNPRPCESTSGALTIRPCDCFHVLFSSKAIKWIDNMVPCLKNRVGGDLIILGIFHQYTCICWGYLLESPCRGDSNEYPYHKFLWTGMEFGDSLRAAEDRESIIAMSSVVPQRPSR